MIDPNFIALMSGLRYACLNAEKGCISILPGKEMTRHVHLECKITEKHAWKPDDKILCCGMSLICPPNHMCIQFEDELFCRKHKEADHYLITPSRIVANEWKLEVY